VARQADAPGRGGTIRLLFAGGLPAARGPAPLRIRGPMLRRDRVASLRGHPCAIGRIAIPFDNGALGGRARDCAAILH